MNKGALLGLGALAALLVFSGGASASPQPAPTPTPPPPAPPKPQPKKPVPAGPPPTPAPTDSGFFNFATGQVDPDPSHSFLSWYPGKDDGAPPPAPPPGGQTTPPPAPPKPAVTLPKAGEKWTLLWSVNRPLSFFEMSAAKSAFRSQMTDQTLDSAMQNAGPPTTVTLQTTYTRDATGPIPVGQVIQKSDVIAKLVSARRAA
jgi:hypothetical protein